MMRYEVVYYNRDGRQVWWPADMNKQTALNALQSAVASGKNNARISEVIS